MPRPNENLFTKDDLKLEARLVQIIKKARSNPGPGTGEIVDRALDDLSNLHNLINKRSGN
jgi:hypothetical protein